MRTKALALTIFMALTALPPATGSPAVVIVRERCLHSFKSIDHDHTSKHASKTCGMRRIGEVEVSKAAGLGQVEIRKNLAAVVQRDEGAVALVDVKNPKEPRVLGRYEDDISDSFDGDLAFSKDGKWLFYARQTHQFSKDGIHVLNIADPAEPTLAFYQPQGGSFRIAYFTQGDTEYVASMDAITGLVINRFEPTTGALVPVYADPLPALKVGGPASAGLAVVKDPKLKSLLLYATNGETGLDVYDISQPGSATKLGSWAEAGLADVEVRSAGGKRHVYAASEYWFDKNTPSTVYLLDATSLDEIKKSKAWTSPLPPNDAWRVNGMELTGRHLNVAYSHLGLVKLGLKGSLDGVYSAPRPVNKSATLKGSPHAMDVDSSGGLLYLTDASTGVLTILKSR